MAHLRANSSIKSLHCRTRPVFNGFHNRGTEEDVGETLGKRRTIKTYIIKLSRRNVSKSFDKIKKDN